MTPLLLMLSLAGADIKASMVRVSVIDGGTPAPVISRARQLNDGKTVPINLATGMPTFINFWGTWCPPCVKELPELAKVSARYQGRVRFIGLLDTKSTHREALAMIERFAVPYENYEIDEVTERAWELDSLPKSFLVDGDGVILWSVSGGMNAAELEEKLERHLNAAEKLLPGEIVAGAGVAIRGDGRVLITRELLQLGDRLVIVTPDGNPSKIDGVLAEDGERMLAIVRVAATLPAVELGAAQVGSDVFLDGKQGKISDVRTHALVHNVAADVRHGTPLTDAQGRVVAITTPIGAVHADAIRAFLATANLDAAPETFGPDVKRNWIISAIFFAVLIFGATGVPAIVRALKRRRRNPSAPIQFH